MSKFDIKMTQEGDLIKVTITGIIDEDVDFSKFPITDFNKILMNLEGIKSINSCGIREWIKWIGTDKKGSIVYDKCPKIIVDQINMVEGFLPANGKVLSFYVPFYSEESGFEKNILFTQGQEFADGKVKIPEGVKDPEGHEMEMDVIESKYFKFLK
jgi:hypothetical protein